MIKAVENKDIENCVNVIKTSFLTVADEFGFTQENASRFTAFAISKERLEWHLHGEHRLMFAYFNNNKIVGYYSLLPQENEECDLNNLCVLPEFRHNKIGEELLVHSFQTAKSLGCIRMNIGIVEENLRLKHWYEHYGFVHTGTEKFDFFPFTCGYMVKEL